MMNQVPLKTTVNYEPVRQENNNETPLGETIRLEPKDLVPQNFGFLFFINGLFLVFGWYPFKILLSTQLISISETLIWIFIVGIVFFLLINGYLNYQSPNNKFNLAFICVTVLGMSFVMLGLWANKNFIAGPTKKIELGVQSLSVFTPPDPGNWRVRVTHTNNLFGNYYLVRRLKYSPDYMKWRSVTYTVEKGILGIYVVKQYNSNKE